MADPLRLVVIGSAAAWTREAGRASSCYLLELDGERLVLDMGQGSFSVLAERTDPERLRAVFISHLHPDHGIDLVPLRHYLRFACRPPGRVELRAPEDMRRRFDVLMGEQNFLQELPGPALAPETIRLDPFEVTAGYVSHLEPSFGFRVAAASADGDSRRPGLVYSGDCGDANDLVALVRPGDTLLSEAYFGAERPVPEARHLTAADAARAAKRGEASRLVLTHLRDGADVEAAVAAARAEFDGRVDVAVPGMELAVE